MQTIREQFIEKYLKEVKPSKDWNEYEKFKRHIQDVAGHDIALFEWAIKELTERMKI